MKNFQRNDLLFSLCGLNCGLCPMNLDNYCPGCGGGDGNQSCAIAKCSLAHGGVEYCYRCDEFPCEKYKNADEYDSFISHRNYQKDFEKAKKIGTEAYKAEQTEKVEILKFLLANYNDGRRKNFFCLAVNLLELEDIKSILKQIEDDSLLNLTAKEKAAHAADLFQGLAAKQNITLKLRKKPK